MPTPTDPRRRYAKFCREGHDLSLPGAFYEFRDGGRRCAICRKASAEQWRLQHIQEQILELVAEQAQAEARHYKAEIVRLQTRIDALRGKQQ